TGVLLRRRARSALRRQGAHRPGADRAEPADDGGLGRGRRAAGAGALTPNARVARAPCLDTARAGDREYAPRRTGRACAVSHPCPATEACAMKVPSLLARCAVAGLVAGATSGPCAAQAVRQVGSWHGVQGAYASVQAAVDAAA